MTKERGMHALILLAIAAAHDPHAQRFHNVIQAAGLNRDLKAPGTAYNDPLIGRDPQPAHMNNFVKTQADAGGVHTNSGIPNKAFYEVATAIGGKAWERAGKIWYRTLIDKIQPQTNFAECAAMTFEVAGTLYGQGSTEQKAVQAGWAVVGIPVGPPLARAAAR